MNRNSYINRIISCILCAVVLLSSFNLFPTAVAAEGTVSIGGTSYDSFEAAFAAAQNGETIVVSGDVTLGAGISVEKTLTVKGESSASINASDTLSGSLFNVSGELTLMNVSVNGAGKTGGSAVVSVNGGSFTMRDGSAVTGGSNGGVDVVSGVFNFHGGSISGNSSVGLGNAVRMSALGELRISGSASIGADSEIYVPGGSYFEISGTLGGSGTMKIRTDSVDSGSMIAMLGSAAELTEAQLSRFVITDGIESRGIKLEGTDIVIESDDVPSDTDEPDDTTGSSDTDEPDDTTDIPEEKDYAVKKGNDKYVTLEEAFESVSANDSVTVTLLRDVTVNSAIVVNGNVTLNADGNCTVTQGSGLKGSMFTVAKGATLTVADTDNVLTVSGNGTDIGAALFDVKGTLKLGESVTVKGNVNKTEKVNKGTVYVNGGAFNMTDGSVTENAAKSGTVYVASGSAALTGGAVYNNTGATAGGVYVASGTLNLNGGSLYDNFADVCGGVYLAKGTFNFSKGAVYNNTGATAGGVYVAAGSFNFSGGSIYDNSGESVWSAVDFSISKNAAIHSSSSYPAGIYLSGTAKIKVADGWKPAAAPNGYDNKISITVKDIKLAYVVAEFAGKAATLDNFVISKKHEDKFVLIAKEKQIVVASDNKDCIVYWGNNAYKTLNEALAELPEKSSATLTIAGDLAVAETATVKAGMNIIITADVNPADFKDFTQRTVKRTANFTGPVFNVEKGATLTLSTPDGKKLILDGENKAVSGSMIVTSGGLSIGKGVTVKGNNNSAAETIKSTHSTFSYGGGIYVDAGGNCTVNGGIITGNYASFGGGVYIKDGALTLGEGEISSNQAVYGGGVYVDTTGSDKNVYGALNMANGKITSNQAKAASAILESGAGGGVYIGNGSSFIMSGGSLSSNSAPIAAGVCVGTAVYTESDETPEPKFTISDRASIASSDTVHLAMIDHSYVTVASALNSQSGSITLSIPAEMPQNMKLAKFAYGNNAEVNEDAAEKSLTKKLFALEKSAADYFEIAVSQVDASMLVNTMGKDEPARAKAGKHYNGLDRFVEGESGRTEKVYGPVVMGMNDSFTAYYNFSYYSNLYKNLETYVTAPFPKGTRIVMVDTSDMKAVGYYYYEVTGEETVVEASEPAEGVKALDIIEIPISAFYKMGTTDEYYAPIINADTSKKAVTTEKLLFVVDFTDVKTENGIKYDGSYVMRLSHYNPGASQGERFDVSSNTNPVSYTIAATSASTVTLTNSKNVIKVDYTMAADSSVVTGNSGVILFQLVDSVFPNGTYLTDSKGAQYICPADSDSIAVPMPTDEKGEVMNIATLEYTIANYYGAALVDVPIRAVAVASVNGTHCVAGAVPEAASEGIRVTVAVEDEYSVLVTEIDSTKKPYYKDYSDLKDLEALKLTVKGLENAAEVETFKLSLLKKKGKEYVPCELSELFKVGKDYGEEAILNTGNLKLDLNENTASLMGNEYKIVFTVGDAVEYVKVNVTEEKK